MRRHKAALLIATVSLVTATCLPAAPATLTVQVDKPGHPISPMLYGIFFEDINCSADGGIYAELVRNRSFEEPGDGSPAHWSPIIDDQANIDIAVATAHPASLYNQRALKVTIANPGKAGFRIANEGYWGIALDKGAQCDLSLLARAADGFTGGLGVSLVNDYDVVYAQQQTPSLTGEWKHYKFSLKSTATDPRARLVISTTNRGTFWLDMVSLFPRKTWKGRPNGLRPDLAEMLAALRPSFVRFPGGCWVEGNTMSDAYRWKQTIGDPAERRTQYNLWQYHATHGLGYHEYLQMCEDLRAEPLFVINCGMSHKENVPLDRMQEFVQDALDAIEYANGPVTSTWGARRAKNGHPKPFHLQYMEIGNEDGGPAYHERYALFYDAIRARFPQMHLIADEWRGTPTNRPIEIVDEHYYSTPEFFIANAGKYDTYDRAGRKVYVGEYAVTQGCGQGNLRAAVGEAAFMTGLERNSDVVVMASYAPLFANVHYKKWNPDLICFDSSRAYGIPSYYVQQMFSANRGDVVLPLTVEAPEAVSTPATGGVGVGTWRTRAEFKDFKVTRGDQTLFTCDAAQGTKCWHLRGGDWTAREAILRQNSLAENVRAFTGNKTWNNYTYTLKARKLGGDEGFLIPFLVQNEDTKSWWNIGGWGNTKHAIEHEGVISDSVPGRIETGRWYDIRIEVGDARVKCFLDGNLIHDLKLQRAKSLYAAASLGNHGKTAILKVVNVSRTAQETEIRLQGAKVRPTAKAIVLAADNPNAENTLDQPTRVRPVTHTLTDAGPAFRYSFPANSVTVLSLQVR
jgi:alpha-L-arabinofuranosidase